MLISTGRSSGSCSGEHGVSKEGWLGKLNVLFYLILLAGGAYCCWTRAGQASRWAVVKALALPFSTVVR